MPLVDEYRTMFKRHARCVSVGLFGLALLAVFVAELTEGLICFGDSGTSCAMGLMNAQLYVAMGGLVPAGGLVFAVWMKRWRVAPVMLGVGLVTYAAWAVLNYMAVHPSA